MLTIKVVLTVLFLSNSHRPLLSNHQKCRPSCSIKVVLTVMVLSNSHRPLLSTDQKRRPSCGLEVIAINVSRFQVHALLELVGPWGANSPVLDLIMEVIGSEYLCTFALCAHGMVSCILLDTVNLTLKMCSQIMVRYLHLHVSIDTDY